MKYFAKTVEIVGKQNNKINLKYKNIIFKHLDFSKCLILSALERIRQWQ